MNKILTVLVVDDEPLAAERLNRLLLDIPDCLALPAANNAITAWQVLQNNTVDVLLLDISMPGESGLDFAKRVSELERAPSVVFCTAYDQHALQAFDAQAIDYLLKPIRAERLAESLQRVRRFAQSQTTRSATERQFISSSVGSSLRRLAIQEILYLHADEKYTVAHHSAGEMIVDASLKELELQFPEQFIRIHRNCLVNKHHLHELRRDTEGRVWAWLKAHNNPLEVSRRCATELKEWLKNS